MSAVTPLRPRPQKSCRMLQRTHVSPTIAQSVRTDRYCQSRRSSDTDFAGSQGDRSVRRIKAMAESHVIARSRANAETVWSAGRPACTTALSDCANPEQVSRHSDVGGPDMCVPTAGTRRYAASPFKTGRSRLESRLSSTEIVPACVPRLTRRARTLANASEIRSRPPRMPVAAHWHRSHRDFLQY